MSGQRETNGDRSVGPNASIRLGDLVKWWPLLLAVMLLTTVAAAWTRAHDVPSYTATTRVVVVPLSQWDETFLGTDLVRDSGDATRTAATVASELNSDRAAEVTARRLGGGWTPEAVRKAVSVTASGETNVIDIVATWTDPDTARNLSAAFADATMADRWQAISGQLDAMIVALKAGSLAVAGDQQGTNPTGAEQAARLQTLTLVRSGAADPTLRVLPTGAPARAAPMSWPITVGLGAVGGLFVAVLAAAGLEMLRSRRRRVSVAQVFDGAPLVPSLNGSGLADARSR